MSLILLVVLAAAHLEDADLLALAMGHHGALDLRAAEEGRADTDAVDETQIMLRKNWDALGSYTKTDRPRSIDLLGFASQLMFTTQLLNFSALLEGKGDVDVIYAVARAHTRHMIEFCSVDKRLLPTDPLRRIDSVIAEGSQPQAESVGIHFYCPRFPGAQSARRE